MIHKSIKAFLMLTLISLPFCKVFSQLPVSGFYPEKGKLTIAPGFSFKSYDEFYRGKELSDGNPAGLGKITSSIFSIYSEYGINEWLSATLTLPYINTQSTDNIADPILNTDKVDGLQDLGVVIKSRIFQHNSTSKLSLGVIGGLTFPVSDYKGEGVLSIGNEAKTISGAAIFQYTTSLNIFAELQMGYSIRSSTDFDIPDASIYRIKLGYYNKYFYIHSALDIQNSLSGLDIGTPEFVDAGGAAILPETEVDYLDLGLNLYIPIYNNSFGISANYTKTIDGRNYGNQSLYGFGIVYTTK